MEGYYDRVLQQTGKQVIAEYQDRINGKVIDTEMSFNPIISVSGEITGVVVFTRDVNERKASNESYSCAKNA